MKTLADFPQFTLRSVQQSEDPDSLLLTGTFDRLNGVSRDSWDYLVQPRPQSLAAAVTNFDETSREATYRVFTNIAEEFDLSPGSKFAWVSSYWDPRMIWAILQGPEAWTDDIFQASEAYTWSDGRGWTNSLEGAKEWAGQEAIRTVHGGWDHEHCSLCNTHIDFADRYWKCDAVEMFLCATCYPASVPMRDLALLFD